MPVFDHRNHLFSPDHGEPISVGVRVGATTLTRVFWGKVGGENESQTFQSRLGGGNRANEFGRPVPAATEEMSTIELSVSLGSKA